MVSGTILFLLGVLSLTRFPFLPPAWPAWFLLLLPVAIRSRLLRWPSCYAAGFLWALLAAHHAISPELDHALEGRTVTLAGQVVSLPERNARRVQFEFRVDRLYGPDGLPARSPGRVRLNWYRPHPEVVPGQYLRLKVRLKRPHGFMNPGGFDYEGWLFRQGIRATGYVRVGGAGNRTAAGFSINRLRYRLRRRLRTVLAGRPNADLILGLALGDRSGISRERWQVLNATGTTHLLAISGLHIGLIAGLIFALVRRLWPLAARAALWLPAPYAGAVAACAAAAGYALLAGLTVPTQRALIMLGMALLGMLWRRTAPSTVLALALLAVLVAEPFAVLAPGMWLSFGAVTVILFALSVRHFTPPPAWRRFAGLQLCIFLGMLPLLAFWFQRVPLPGMLANSLAIPWISFICVPLILAGVLLLPVHAAAAGFVLGLADLSLGLIWKFLAALAGPAAALVHLPPVPPILLAAALPGAVLLLLPRGTPARWLGGLWLLPLLVPAVPRLPANSLRFTLLDVGQGLAAVVQTRNHVLTYDTGPAYSDSFNTGWAVLLPYLEQAAVRRIDIHVQSHGDSDHIGGLAALLAGIPVDRILTSVPGRIRHPAVAPCRAGRRWRWDGVRFTILHPPADSRFTGNNRSCVLKISLHQFSILLPGDIERPAEDALLASRPQALRATVLVAPHHGSSSSSSRGFVDAVAPGYVLFATGYLNRYRFPKHDIMARYRAAGAELFDTARDGAIQFSVNGQGLRVVRERVRDRRFWRYRPRSRRPDTNPRP